MGEATPQGSAASRVFLTVVVAVAALVAVLAVVLILDAQRAARTEAEEVTRAVAESLAVMPQVVSDVTEAEASARLQPVAVDVMEHAHVDFVDLGLKARHSGARPKCPSAMD